MSEIQEKAEKWDELHRQYDALCTKHDRYVFETSKKLEAIKNWFNDWINPWLDKAGEEGFMLPKKRMVSLKKILEAEG